MPVRGAAYELQGYCAIVQHSPIEVEDAVFGDVLGQAKLRIAEPQTPKVHESVLVLVPEVVDGPQVAAVEPPVSLWVGLKRLDECLWARADAPDLVHPTGGGPRSLLLAPLAEPGPPFVDREGAPIHLLPGPVHTQPVDGLVESRPEVVDGLAENDRPINRDWRGEPEPKEVLASLVVYLWRKAPAARTPWVACIPRGHFSVEVSEVLIRSRDLSLYPREGTRVNLHDMILRPATGTLGEGGASLLAPDERRLTPEEFREHFGHLPTDGEG